VKERELTSKPNSFLAMNAQGLQKIAENGFVEL
jgi:hypothetical protein